MDWILDNVNRLNEARVAKTRVRPLRLAYIVPDDDPQIIRRVINSCCLTWGGAINPLIPYSRSRGFLSGWLEMLQIFDPDNLIDCVGISDSDKKQFVDRGQHIHNWEKPYETFLMVGTLQYSAMNAFAKEMKTDKRKVIIQPKLEPNNKNLLLPLIAKYGELDERFLDETMKNHGVTKDIKYANFANISEVDFSQKTEDILLGITPSSNIQSELGASSIYDLLNLTKLGIARIYKRYSFNDSYEEKAHADNIIITGKNDCVSDLCLYWNIRIDRPHTMCLPIWIPLDLFTSMEGLKIVTKALALAHGTGSSFAINSSIYVLSTSSNKQELENKLKNKGIDFKFETKELQRFISDGSEYYCVEESREVHFNHGNVRIPIPKYEPLKQFAPEDRVVHETTFSGVKLPMSKSLNDRKWGTLLRQTRRGFEGFSYVSHWSDMISIGIPSHWSILEYVFRDLGYDCQPSDKSLFALGLLHLFERIEDLRIISSSRVHKVLKEMCTIRGQQEEKRKFYAEREAWEYSLIKKELGDQTDLILNWLIKKGLIFRGAKIKCPICALNKWYELDRINKAWHCDGCLNNLTPPLNLNNLNWSYRINELYARSQDQGAITPLLCMYALYHTTMFSGDSTLGYYPGVTIKAISQNVVKQTDIRQMEIDLVAIREGHLIIAECKDTGKNLKEEEVKRYVSLANYLKCSQLLFITPQEFLQTEALSIEAQKKCSASIEWWEGSDIFDVSILDRIRDEQETNVPKEVRALTYLKKLAEGL